MVKGIVESIGLLDNGPLTKVLRAWYGSLLMYYRLLLHLAP